MRIFVDFAPLTEVALVDVPGVTMTPGSSPACYAVSPRWGCRDENAPQMFNVHMDSTLEMGVEMDDEHPFPKVLAELQRRMDVEIPKLLERLEPQ